MFYFVTFVIPLFSSDFIMLISQIHIEIDNLSFFLYVFVQMATDMTTDVSACILITEPQ